MRTLVSSGSIIGKLDQGVGRRWELPADMMKVLQPVAERDRKQGHEATLDTVSFMNVLVCIMQRLPDDLRLGGTTNCVFFFGGLSYIFSWWDLIISILAIWISLEIQVSYLNRVFFFWILPYLNSWKTAVQNWSLKRQLSPLMGLFLGRAMITSVPHPIGPAVFGHISVVAEYDSDPLDFGCPN